MSLNIKRPEAHALAERLAKLTGETLTDAVTAALRERLAGLEQKPDFDEALYRKAQGDSDRLPQAHEGAVPLDGARRPALRRARTAEMIVDASALVAVVRNESGADRFFRALSDPGEPKRMSAANYLEAAIVIDGSRSPIASRGFDDAVAAAGSQSNR